ncbi:hypothetical protein RDI58_006898 [Solanum bulbocastanum]|uniref:Uncharacterized protein n=1 Tax=Solanum bulbocastanum TaxID=147425 RepID=A0AAN8TT26_SOLBU
MLQKAIVCYQRAIQARSDYAMAFDETPPYLADVYYEQGNLEMAIRNFRRAIARDTEFFEAYNNMGHVLKDAGEVQEAIHAIMNMMSAATQCYKASLAVSTGLSTPFNNLGIIYMQQRNYAQAISCFNELLRINPMSTDGLVKRGNTYIRIGRVDEAIQDYTKAIAIRPTMEDVHALLASAYMTSGNVEAAIKGYRQALMLCADFPEATCNLFHTLQMSIAPSVEPFQAIAYPLDPILALDIRGQELRYLP